MQTMAKQPDRGDHNDSCNRRLHDPQDDGDSKQPATSRPVADSLRAGNKCDDCIVETEDPNLANGVSGRPGDGEYTEGRGPEQPRDEKCENTAEIRRQHPDRVQEGAAL